MGIVKIQFTTSAIKIKPLAWLIQLFERTRYSHVRFYLEISDNKKIVFEASGSSVKFLGPKAIEKVPVRIIKEYAIHATPEEIVYAFLPYAGIKYGFWQLVGIGIARIFGLKKNPFSNGKRSIICSELVGVIIKDVWKMTPYIDFDLLSPRDLEKFMDEYPMLFMPLDKK